MVDREQQVYDFLVMYRKEKGMSPSFREIGKACGIPSTSNVRYWLDSLARRGLIEHYKGVARGIVVKPSPPAPLPLGEGGRSKGND